MNLAVTNRPRLAERAGALGRACSDLVNTSAKGRKEA
jgi:hypothetical protein